MDNAIFTILMELPLFAGATINSIADVIGTTRLHFLKYTPGEKIVTAGEPCTHLKFIISGSARSVIENNDHRFRVSQTLAKSAVIAPDFLFGRLTSYPNTVTAIEPCSILQIAKSDYMDLLLKNEVFMLNYINLLSMNAQKSVSGVLAITTGSLEERIAFWIIALSQRGGTDITLTCRQRDLYALFGVQRSSFINTLESMRDRGLITFTQQEIRVTDRDRLLSLLTNSTED